MSQTIESLRAEVDEAGAAHDTERLMTLHAKLMENGSDVAVATASMALGRAQNEQGLLNESRVSFEDAVHRFKALDMPREEVGNRVNLLNVLRDQGEYKAALEHIDICHELITAHDLQSLLFVLHNNAGLIHVHLSEFDKALESYELALMQDLGKYGDRKRAIAHANLAGLFLKVSDYPVSLQHALKSRELLGKDAPDIEVGKAHHTIGTIHNHMSDHKRALPEFYKAKELYHKAGDKLMQSMILGAIASASTKAGDTDNVEAILLESLSISDNLDADQYSAPVAMQLCHYYGSLGQFDRVRELTEKYRQALLATKPNQIEYWTVLGLLLMEEEKYDEAKTLFEKAFDIATDMGTQTSIAEAHRQLRYVAEKTGDMQAYILHNQEMNTINDRVRGAETQRLMSVQEKNRELENAKAEADRHRELIHATLPKHIADRMLDGEDVSGDEHTSACVLFIDIAGFTTNSSQMNAKDVSTLLADIFAFFDTVCVQHNITKIKTIGDAYLAVAFDLDDESVAEAHTRMRQAAIDMLDSSFTWPNGSNVEYRAGIHIGPVVAGVIGSERLQYDVWGDTVNTASRMESTGESGRIHVSENFANRFEAPSQLFELRGEIEVKGKGLMKTYWVNVNE